MNEARELRSRMWDHIPENFMGRRSRMKKDQPPKWIIRLIEWYCHPDYAKEIVGDLQELFFKWKSEKGPFIANILYVFNALLFARAYNSRFLQNSSKSNELVMIKNYFFVCGTCANEK